jgi:hypothetical protein
MRILIKFDILIKGGVLVDPANQRQGRFDVGLSAGQVAEVEPEIPLDFAREVYDATKRVVLPGLVDTHVHLTPPGDAVGFRMLACAGVTCALDCGGPVEDVIEGMAQSGSGISVAALNALDPSVSISGPGASKRELAEYLDRSLESGAFGIKLLGGHLPLSPETTATAIELANKSGAYVAFHCGSTRNGSNLYGLLDAFEFAGDNRLHICHVNAYCRGLTHGSPVAETMIALKELAVRRHLVSESHMATMNGCNSELEGDVPRSHVTRTCLKMGGFEPNREGLLSAAHTGYMRVQKRIAQRVIYLEPEEGVAHLKNNNCQANVSFPVNRRSTAFLMATEKDEDGRFIVPALSTDGGGIPRNFLLSHGLSLVEFDALTLPEFVQKCSWMPARMLGLRNKGHLGPGADGDLLVADQDTHQALLTLAGGKVVMMNGIVVGSGGTLITTDRLKKTLQHEGISTQMADSSLNLFFTTPGY